jgi:hypothetical protein
MPEVNVDASQGEFFVEVLDANDKPYRGYGWDIKHVSKGVR